ncbi:NEDD8-activating enzyme E1 catalytic subunit [Phytophthora cactorum]|nr:NEDD8-activating enzyme E1 catalytic subunit [Phytophthora cactorum]
MSYCSRLMNNYHMHMGATGCYSHTFQYDRKADCVVCSSQQKTLQVDPDATTLQKLIDELCGDDFRLLKPSISSATANLFMQGPPALRSATSPNLVKPLRDLVKDGENLTITDAVFVGDMALSLQLIFKPKIKNGQPHHVRDVFLVRAHKHLDKPGRHVSRRPSPGFLLCGLRTDVRRPTLFHPWPTRRIRLVLHSELATRTPRDLVRRISGSRNTRRKTHSRPTPTSSLNDTLIPLCSRVFNALAVRVFPWIGEHCERHRVLRLLKAEGNHSRVRALQERHSLVPLPRPLVHERRAEFDVRVLDHLVRLRVDGVQFLYERLEERRALLLPPARLFALQQHETLELAAR